MKQSDLITIVLVTGIAVFASFLVTNLLLGNPDEASVTFKTIDTISSDVVAPDPEVFNVDAINPTVNVSIGTCVDADNNGILENEELSDCGMGEEIEDDDIEEEEEEDAENKENNNANNTDKDEE